MSDPMPICFSHKRELEAKGYEVKILRGRLFYKMSCIYCGHATNCLGTIEKVNASRKVVLATV